MQQTNEQPANDGFIEIRSPQGYLLFRYNQQRQLLEIKRGALMIYVDMAALDAGDAADKPAVYTALVK